MENRATVVQSVADALMRLSRSAFDLLRLYENNQWLNDEIVISDLIPMSLDEWHIEINTRAEEIRTWHK